MDDASASRLPIEDHIEDLLKVLEGGRDVLLSAPPGAGKSTVVPGAVADQSWCQGKDRKSKTLEVLEIMSSACCRIFRGFQCSITKEWLCPRSWTLPTGIQNPGWAVGFEPLLCTDVSLNFQNLNCQLALASASWQLKRAGGSSG